MPVGVTDTAEKARTLLNSQRTISKAYQNGVDNSLNIYLPIHTIHGTTHNDLLIDEKYHVVSPGLTNSIPAENSEQRSFLRLGYIC